MTTNTNGGKMLPRVVRPIAGENVVGLISRLADAMCAPFSSVLNFLEIRSDFMLREDTWLRLSEALGLDEEAFSPMRRETIRLGRQSGGVRLLNNTFHHYLIVRGSLRVCPTCIREGHPILEQWDLAHAPVCVRHKCLLVDTCACGKSLSRRYRGTKTAFSCTCGIRFMDLHAAKASAAMLQIGSIVRSALSGRPCSSLDPQLANLPLADLLCVAHVAGVASITPVDKDEAITPTGAIYLSIRPEESVRSVASMVPVVEAALPILLDWEGRYKDLLANVAGRNANSGCVSANALFSTRIGRTLRRPPRGIDWIPIPCMTLALDEFCEQMHSIKRRHLSVRRDSPVARKIEPILSRRQIAIELNAYDADPQLRRIYEDVVREFDRIGLAGMERNPLAARVKNEVLRRWLNTEQTISTDNAMRYLNNPNSTSTSNDWIHPSLLVPVDASELGVDRTLNKRRRGISFRKVDVEALRDRIASKTRIVMSEEEMRGFNRSAQCRKFHGGGWPRKDFLLAFLEGRIPACSFIERPRICDIWFHLETIRDLSLEHRVQAFIEKDVFAVAHRCRSLIAELWGRPPEHLSDYHLRELRRTEAVRNTDVRNRTEDRDRPRYHYSVMDLVQRARLLQGDTVTPLVDRIVDTHASSLPDGKQISVDDEQMATNEYLSNLASYVGLSLKGISGRSRPNQENATPRGWRRATQTDTDCPAT